MARHPEPDRSLRRELEKMRDEIRAIRNSPTLSGTGLSTIDEGQVLNSGLVYVGPDGMLLVDGGDVKMLNDDLVEIFAIGEMPNGDVGLRIKRGDDSTAIEMRDVFGDGTGPQSLLFLTRTGQIFGGDSVLANGIAAPYMHHNFTPVDPSVPVPAVSATSFTATHECYTNYQNPAIRPTLKVKCSDGTTAGEVQIWDVLNSTYLGGYFGSPATRTLTIPAGTTTWTPLQFDGTCMLAGDFGDAVQIEFHVKRTAGSGSISISPLQTLGSDA